MKQIVEHKKLSAARGILLIALLIAALIGLDYFCARLLPRVIGVRAASLLFWVFGGVIALAMLRVYVVKFIYELTDDVLRLERSYGKRPRHIEDIYLNRIFFVGDPAEAKQRCPNARRVSATREDAGFPTVAVLYRTSDGNGLALIQPNEELRAKLEERARENRKK